MEKVRLLTFSYFPTKNGEDYLFVHSNGQAIRDIGPILETLWCAEGNGGRFFPQTLRETVCTKVFYHIFQSGAKFILSRVGRVYFPEVASEDVHTIMELVGDYKAALTKPILKREAENRSKIADTFYEYFLFSLYLFKSSNRYNSACIPRFIAIVLILCDNPSRQNTFSPLDIVPSHGAVKRKCKRCGILNSNARKKCSSCNDQLVAPKYVSKESFQSGASSPLSP